MCGIAGSFNVNVSMAALLAAQSSRGPDATGIFSIALPKGSMLHLGHNRLKILCLSDAANQPLRDESGLHHLVFNGEIYNYRELKSELQAAGAIFHTESDSEVLLLALKCWGLAAISKLTGMFAFAYFNQATQQLYLVRDRFGVKPLYYFFADKSLCFASTSAGIAKALNLQPNFVYLKRGLQYGIYEDDGDITAYDGLRAVRPGHFIQLSLDDKCNYKNVRYYDLTTRVDALIEDAGYKSPAQWQALVEEVLTNATITRLHADVPVAVTLSGGLDSSLIAVLARRHQNIEGFCFGSYDDTTSEGPEALSVAVMHGIKMHFVSPDPSLWVDAFWQTLNHQDAPIAGLSVVAQYLLYQSIKEARVSVVLGGQGGDEAFLGYRKFQWFYLRQLLARRQIPAAASFFLGFSRMLLAERSRLTSFWQSRARYTKHSGLSSGLLLPGEDAHMEIGNAGNIASRQISDILQYSLPTLLRYEDRNSMAHSIESRLPFLDYRVMELACALPIALKLKNGFGKWVLRAIMAGRLPNSVRLARYKRGFDVPQTRCILTALAPSINERLHAAKAQIQPFLRHEARAYFSITELLQSPQRFTELTTILWLIDKGYR